MLEDMGNAVKINGQIVPAWNIWRVALDSGTTIDVGPVAYFEVMFERGTLWVVTVDRDEDTIEIEHYDNAKGMQDPDLTYLTHGAWDIFLILYNHEARVMPEDRGALCDACRPGYVVSA